ncbi:MAG: Lrp/AsnC family transcriptional regulator [Deltaproteobacteria bacterium]|nr:Lrp/AsnC family transcriptional regulator [Deltaproteobacteria bacterium]
MKKSLDDIDARMIQLLRAHARTPLVSLAKQVGLSRSATQERLRRLESQGVIAGYTVLFQPPDDSALQAWIYIKFASGFRCADVVPHLLASPQVRLCHSLAGTTDLVLRVETASSGELSKLRESWMEIEGISEALTHPVLEVHYEGNGQRSPIGGALPLEGAATGSHPGASPKEKP